MYINRQVPVNAFIDDTYIGYGSLVYEDEFDILPNETIKNKCVSLQLCIDNDCYDNDLVFCYEDKISSGSGGEDTKTIYATITDFNGNQIGQATIPFVDRYNPISIDAFGLFTVIYAVAISLLSGVDKLIKKWGENR
jgi:hypothetical protein